MFLVVWQMLGTTHKIGPMPLVEAQAEVAAAKMQGVSARIVAVE
jgi:hypothetical protein